MMPTHATYFQPGIPSVAHSVSCNALGSSGEIKTVLCQYYVPLLLLFFNLNLNFDYKTITAEENLFPTKLTKRTS